MDRFPLHESLSEPTFWNSKKSYLVDLAKHVKDSLRLHKSRGLLDKNAEGKREWGNVTTHCLMEAARVEIFADLLGLDDSLKSDLMMAAAIHDFYKKDEITKLRANNTSWEAYNEAQQEAAALMQQAGINERVIRLATAVGHETIPEAQRLIAQAKPLSPEEIAWLVMHYVDDYTVNDRWVQPSQKEGDILINDLDRRMEIVFANAQPGGKYHGINQAGLEHFGELTYVLQARVGKVVEARLGSIMAERQTEVSIANAALLPEIVDQLLIQRINLIAS